MSMEQINSVVMSGVESAAQMSIGQMFLKLVDRVLWIIEKSVQWSLPTQELTVEENGKLFGKVELVRPLPWVFFLPSLIILRMIRFGVNMGAHILGYPELEPSDMVRMIQRGRRRIRSIKSSGLKSMRLKRAPAIKDSSMTMKEASKNLAKSMRLILSTLSCLDSGSKTSPSPPPTKIRVSNILDTAQPVSEEKERNNDLSTALHTDSKRKYSEISSDEFSDESDEEPLVSKIDRLVNDSGSDKDFTISDCPTEITDSSESELDVSIPLSEIQYLKSENEEMEKVCRADGECINSQSDNELHKPSQGTRSRSSRPDWEVNQPEDDEHQRESVASSEAYCATTNGVGGDPDTAYYSPISWKSVSPELSFSSDDKQCLLSEDNQGDYGAKTEELSNGEATIKNDKDEKDCDSNKACVEPSGAIGANGHMKEKQRTTSHSSGSGKHHQKNKKGNHGNRKKK